MREILGQSIASPNVSYKQQLQNLQPWLLGPQDELSTYLRSHLGSSDWAPNWNKLLKHKHSHVYTVYMVELVLIKWHFKAKQSINSQRRNQWCMFSPFQYYQYCVVRRDRQVISLIQLSFLSIYSISESVLGIGIIEKNKVSSCYHSAASLKDLQELEKEKKLARAFY